MDQDLEKYKQLLNKEIDFCLNDQRIFSFYLTSIEDTGTTMVGLAGQGKVYRIFVKHKPPIPETENNYQLYPQSVLEDLLNANEAANPMNPMMKYKISKPKPAN